MKRIEIIPESREHWLSLRHKNINSTDISVLFGVSPYCTLFELWHKIQSPQPIEIETSERMRWGNYLQDAIANGIALEQGWKVKKMDQYVFLPEHAIGSSFDFTIEDQDAILEIKNVDYFMMKEWKNDIGEIEAPPHIELQIQQQMLVSGKNTAYIAALVGGNKIELIKRNFDLEIGQAIISKTKEFFSMSEAPEPNYIEDSEFIKQLHSNANGLMLETDNYLEHCQRYKAYAKMEADAKKLKEGVKAEILMSIGATEKIKGNFYSISAGITRRKEYIAPASQFRNFKVTIKGERDE